MPSDDRYRSITVTTAAREAIAEVKTLLFRLGVPEGIPAPVRALEVSNVIEIACQLAKKAIEAPRRRKKA